VQYETSYHRRQQVQVVPGPRGADVGVLGNDRRAVEHSPQTPDHHVANPMEVESGDDLLGAKGQGTREARASSTKVRND